MGIRLDISLPSLRVAESFGDVQRTREVEGEVDAGVGESVEGGGRGARNGGRFMLPRLVSHTYIVNLTLPSSLRLPGEKLAKLDGKAWKSWDVFAAFSGFYPTIKPLVREEDSKYIYFASSKNTIETLASKLLINGRNSSRGERTSILVV